MSEEVVKPVIGEQYEDVDGRKFKPLEIDEGNIRGREVAGTLLIPDGREYNYCCTMEGFQRVWVQRVPEMPPPVGNAGGSTAIDG